MTTRSASAVWRGDLPTGDGDLSLGSGHLTAAPYTFVSRFQTGEGGTNPEELIGAAHAACRRREQSENGAQQRCLAAAAGPHHRPPRTGRHGEADALYHGPSGGVARTQRLDAERGRSGLTHGFLFRSVWS